MAHVDRQAWDVVVVGAGGAGLRAAIEAREAGMRTAVICKSLFGKAHTVMAEGGIAASMGNANAHDNWQVHFRDTMRGGKFLNQWRMAELHAREAPDRVWELETWGALFDRTADGRISQRNFGGHEYPRLAHVGDRTGLELIRTLQQKIVSLQQEDEREFGAYDARLKVFQECTVTRVLKDGRGRVSGAFCYERESGRFFVLEAPAVVLATGGIGKSFKVTSNSWEYTGDGHALALLAGAPLINMEFVQFHPTGMVWPPSVKGILVTESVRGDGGVLRNSEGKRFMFDYIPDVFKEKYAADRGGGRPLVRGPGQQPPPARTAAPRRGRPRHQRRGQGGPRLPARRGLPGRLDPDAGRGDQAPAAVDAPPVQGAGGCGHHRRADGGRPDLPLRDGRGGRGPGHRGGDRRTGPVRGRRGGRRDARLQPARRQLAVRPAGLRPPGGAARGRVRGGAGRTAGPRPARRSTRRRRRRCAPSAPRVERGRPGREPGPAENPYTLHQELQQAMNDLVGIIRKEGEMFEALKRLADLRVRARRAGVEGHRQYNPGWHLAIDLRNMLLVSECVARAALEREESRGGHTRDDHPAMDRSWRNINLVCRFADPQGDARAAEPALGQIRLSRRETPPIRRDLLELFEKDELAKYLTDEELSR